MDPKQNEMYKLALAHINHLEQQLSSINDNQVDLKAMEEQIEVHFNKCLNALAARKDRLLRELAEKAGTLRKTVGEACLEVQQVVQAQREILNAGATAFKFDSMSAEHVWKGILTMNPQPLFGTHITLKLPDSLSKSIQDHGQVVVLGEIPAAKNSETPDIDFSNPKVVPFVGSSEGMQDGMGAVAKFASPQGICWSVARNCFFVCDYGNNAIRKISLQGMVSTAVQGELLKSPHGIVEHEKSNELFVTNHNGHNILKISAAGTVSVVAGSGTAGRTDGTGLAASFNRPHGIAIDQQTGTLFISDENHLIRKITPQGVVSTLAGSSAGYLDGTGTAAQFHIPWGLCYKDHSLFVCDYGNNKIRQVSLNGDVTTVCEYMLSPSHIIATNNSFLVSSLAQKKIFTIQGKTVIGHKITLGNQPAGITLQGLSCYVADCEDKNIIQIHYR